MSERRVQWLKEQLFFQADDYFEHMLSHMENAKKSIRFEVYIFDSCPLGDRVAKTLLASAKRGVKVQVMVDGVGSPNWSRDYLPHFQAAGVEARVFHPLPSLEIAGLRFFWKRLLSMNRRNHRKLCIIDEQLAWAGGMNVSDAHRDWRDTAISIQGGSVQVLIQAFEWAWNEAKASGKFLGLRNRTLHKLRHPFHGLARWNGQRKARQEAFADLVKRIRHASFRVWITNAYFVPTRQLLRALGLAPVRGVDVKILVPRLSDIFFIPWVSHVYYYPLIQKGVRIYEYLPRTLHAKSLSIDDWSLVGSSNLNHRSILHDLEVDIVLTHPETRNELNQQFLWDLAEAQEFTLEDWKKRPFVVRWLGKLFHVFRHWM